MLHESMEYFKVFHDEFYDCPKYSSENYVIQSIDFFGVAYRPLRRSYENLIKEMCD